jgi:decaprenyl-phosphate phosphoribosyltransferase
MMIKNLLDVFRPKRWYRNLTMVLGSVIALKLLHISFHQITRASTLTHFFIVLIATCLVASGNYGINEVLDAEADSHHPEKKHRAIPSGRISARLVIYLSILWYVLGLAMVAALGNVAVFVSVALLFVSGIVYNVPPIRLKDRAYVDFTSEALNNPIRFLIGWYAITNSHHIAPASFVLGYWFLGVFLMASKRFGEIRIINNQKTAKKYRLSLAHYTEEKLLMSMIAGLTAFSYMFGALSLKYSVDVILVLPFIVGWVVWFFALAFEKDTIVISPERIFEKGYFMSYSIIVLAVFIFCFYTGNQFLGWVK